MVMVKLTIRWLENSSEEELGKLNDVLQKAFGDDDPFTDYLVDGDRSLVSLNFESRLRAAAARGRIQVASYGPKVEDIVGAAVWFPPGQRSNGTKEQLKTGGSMFLDKAPENLRKWWLEHFIPSGERLEAETVGAGFKKANWSLALFGVLPEHHRKGIGKAMMKVVEDIAKEEKTSIVIKTVSPVDLIIYGKMGFEVKGHVTVTSRFGSCPVYQLLKTP